MATAKKNVLETGVNAREYVSKRVAAGTRDLTAQEAEALRSLYVQYSEQVLEEKPEEVVAGPARPTV